MFLKDNRDSFLFKSAVVLFLRPQRILQVIINFFRDYKYGGRYLGFPLHNQNDFFGYTNTTSSEYFVLKNLFSGIDINENDVLVDVGCGKGRVLNWFLSHMPKNQIIGIEIDSEVAHFSKNRLEKYKNVEVMHGNIEEDSRFLVGTIYYLFNPFGENTMRFLLRDF